MKNTIKVLEDRVERQKKTLDETLLKLEAARKDNCKDRLQKMPALISELGALKLSDDEIRGALLEAMEDPAAAGRFRKRAEADRSRRGVKKRRESKRADHSADQEPQAAEPAANTSA